MLRLLAVWVVLVGVALAEEKPLIWGADAEGGAPYIFYDPSRPGQLTGFEVDLIRALEARLRRRIQFRQYDFKRLVEGLERGDLDLAMNGLEVTQDRALRVRFTRPYYVFRLQLVVRRGDERCRNLSACAASGGVVGTLENTAASRLLSNLGVRTLLYDSQVTPFEDLALGRLDAVLLDVPIIRAFLLSWPSLEAVDPPVAGRGYYAIAVRPQDEELARQLNQALDALAAEGELQAILGRWGLWDQGQEELLPAGEFFPGHRPPRESAPGSLGAPRRLFTLKLLARAALVTVALSVVSMALAVMVGLCVASARLYGPRWVQGLALAYVEFFRGVPVLLLLYLLYFGLPTAWQALTGQPGLHIPPFWTAVVGLGLTYGAYEAEIYRAALLSIPHSQWEAAASLGLSRRQTFLHVVLPQALRVALPPSTTDFVALFKDTSLAGTITVVELAKQYQILSTSGGDFRLLVEAGLVTACLYLCMSLPLGHWARRWERRLATAP
ncbi:MAG: ABC transporter substrate-binding protein/permease [Thermoanaerobaculum sp.]|nr:ABC transporter substrate-binding protein/permease [Thermoanaerobaculum sp.]MDW7967760.1 ABC transporter substrate-binding protein/permease [Thermoanaerobaculum sp.]